MNNIILCGFMGCGKTTIGKLYAKNNGMVFVDMDQYIEQQEQKTVSEIFSEHGEPYFRELEHSACKALAEKSGLVIAAGGGALTFARNTAVLSKTGTIIFIDVPLAILTKRLARDTTRPLLQRPDRNKVIKDLYYKRRPKYKKAARFSVNGTGSPLNIAKAISGLLKAKGLAD